MAATKKNRGNVTHEPLTVSPRASASDLRSSAQRPAPINTPSNHHGAPVDSPIAAPSASPPVTSKSTPVPTRPSAKSMLASPPPTLKAFTPTSIQSQMRDGLSFIASGIDTGAGFANKHTKRAVRTVDEKIDGQLPDLVGNVVGGGFHGYAATKVTKNFIKVEGERKPAPESTVIQHGISPPGQRQAPMTSASAPPAIGAAPMSSNNKQKSAASGGGSKLKRLFSGKQRTTM